MAADTFSTSIVFLHLFFTKKLHLKGKELKNTTELCLNVFEKLHIWCKLRGNRIRTFEDNAILCFQNGC